ncbi:MAG: RNA polymerase factor sigma-54 [Rhizobiaceae bacterium]|jgi:RNA polymerase sigma-54 factor|nr:RNA polymerase factor sigma-54 [Rhizobiaceae bacterium]
MSISAQLQLRQGQALVMTPQLLQSIRLLQLSQLELEQFIASEIEKNPFLRRDDGADTPDDPSWHVAGDQPQGSAEQAGDVSADNVVSAELDVSAQALSSNLDAPLDTVFPDALPETLPGLGDMGRGSAMQRDPFAALPDDLEDRLSAPPTLAEHLRAQLPLLRLSLADAALAHVLIDALDDNGYLPGDAADYGAELGVDEAGCEVLLRRLHTLEPAGVFARSLAECLALQLKAKNRLDPAMQALLAHLPLLAKRDFAALSPICSVDRDDLMDMLTEIRHLDPKPGAAFARSGAEPVVPDVVVGAAPAGGWAVTLNPDALPRVLVDRPYHARISGSARNEEDRLFLSECLKNATWLERSLDQRARTVLKVATEIVRQQDAFFVHGVSGLRPLTLRMLAELVEMHESTISRVTVNKFMATPRGTFELRYFFTAAIASADDAGDAHSAEAVRHRIRALIEAETARNVLSDDAIVDALKGEKIDIARRTVAKYREAMGIASSVERRREKRAVAGL